MTYRERVKDVLSAPSENRSVFSPEFRAKRNASSAVAIAAQADAEIARLRAAMQLALDAGTIELNLGNYGHDEVCQLQHEATEQWQILTAALSPATDEERE